LSAAPDPLAAMRGPTSKRKGEMDEGRGGEGGRERRRRERKGRGEGMGPPAFWVKFTPLIVC